MGDTDLLEEKDSLSRLQRRASSRAVQRCVIPRKVGRSQFGCTAAGWAESESTAPHHRTPEPSPLSQRPRPVGTATARPAAAGPQKACSPTTARTGQAADQGGVCHTPPAPAPAPALAPAPAPAPKPAQLAAWAQPGARGPPAVLAAERGAAASHQCQLHTAGSQSRCGAASASGAVSACSQHPRRSAPSGGGAVSGSGAGGSSGSSLTAVVFRLFAAATPTV